jgi:PBP1b-binding outer membrane lipoprotein LpoB
MKVVKYIASLIILMLVIGCNPMKNTAEAEKAAAEFHALFDAQNFEKIYDDAHPDLKSAQSKADLVSFIKTVRERLGPVKAKERTGWQANSYNLKTNAVLTYSTQFEHGQGTETFTYRIADGKASLLGWHINSNALIINPGSPPPDASKPQS